NVVTLAPEEMFYRMARFREFDVSELSLSTYTVLRGRGEPLVAIPVFPSFSFRHSSIFVGTHAGITGPKDLVGKRVGVPKYHMTAAVWIRGMLEDDRDRHERFAAAAEHRVGRERELRDVELTEARHAVEHLFRGERDHVQLDPVGLHLARADRPRAVVVAARERQIQSRHAGHRAAAAAGSTTADV